jgi:hypothetical protein
MLRRRECFSQIGDKSAEIVDQLDLFYTVTGKPPATSPIRPTMRPALAINAQEIHIADNLSCREERDPARATGSQQIASVPKNTKSTYVDTTNRE